MDMFLGLAFTAFLSSAKALSFTSSRPGNTVFDNCGFNLSATCDDKMRLFADDKLLATSDNWKTTSVVNIPAGTRVIEIHCVDSWIHGGILASSEDTGLLTDGAWSCSSDNRATWKPAYLLGTNGVTAPEISPQAKWIWTEMNTWKHTHQRRHTTAICKIQLEPTACPPVTGPVYPHWCSDPTTVSSTEPTTVSSTASTSTETTPSPPGFDLTATCDDKMKLFADGTLLASSDDWKVPTLVSIPADTQVIEIHCMDTGILGGIVASSHSGLITNRTWSCSSDNGTTWSSAYEVGPNGASVPDIAAEARWIWTGCTGDWTAKYTGNKQPNNVICKTILPVTSTSTNKFTSTPTTITPTTLIPEVFNGTCYQIILAGSSTRSPTNTPEECKLHCYFEGFSFAGVQRKKCWCGNEEPPVSRIRDSSECDMDCPGDSQQKCGGRSRANIYKTGFKDKYEECSFWKHICTSDEFGICMNTNCPKTCKLEISGNNGLDQGFPEVSTIMTASMATNSEASTQSAMMSTLSLPSSNSSG